MPWSRPRSSTSGRPSAIWLRIQRLTGMRPGELMQLAAQHIDRKNQVWLFRPPKHKTKKRGKNGSSRSVLEGPSDFAKVSLLDAVFSLLDGELSTPLARGCDRAFPHPAIAAIAGSDLPAPQENAGHCGEETRDSRRSWPSGRVSTAWHPHQIRHSAAEVVRETFGLEHAQHVLGHSKADVTQIYAKGNVQKAVEVALAIG